MPMTGRGRGRRGFVALALTVAFTPGLAACGDEPTGIGADAAGLLQPQVVTVQAAVQAGDADGARSRLDDLRRRVEGLVSDGTLTQEEADPILDAIADVETSLGSLVITTAPTTTPPTTDAPSTTRPETTTTTEDERPKDDKDKKDEEEEPDEDDGDVTTTTPVTAAHS